MPIQCRSGGNLHEHETVMDVKMCWGKVVPEDTMGVRSQNIMPAGPSTKPGSQSNLERRAEQDRNTRLALAGQPHGFTSHCPECVAGVGHSSSQKGTHTPPQRDEDWDAQIQERERLEDERVYTAKMERDRIALNVPAEDEFRVNNYGGECIDCHNRVGAEQGRLAGKVGKKWTVRHRTGECPPNSPQRENTQNDSRPKPESKGPVKADIPQGLYATPSLTGNNDLDFWRVRPAQKVGHVWINRVIGGKQDQALAKDSKERIKSTGVPKVIAVNALEVILAFGVEKSQYIAGIELKFCRRCGIHLTDEESRRNGIGPDCATME